MKKIVALLFVFAMLFVMIGCGKEEEPTQPTVIVEEDVQEVLDTLGNQDYLLALIIERREASGGYEYLIKLSNQERYDRETWYFSEDYLLTGNIYPFIKINETTYYLTGIIND